MPSPPSVGTPTRASLPYSTTWALVTIRSGCETAKPLPSPVSVPIRRGAPALADQRTVRDGEPAGVRDGLRYCDSSTVPTTKRVTTREGTTSIQVGTARLDRVGGACVPGSDVSEAKRYP